MTSVQSLIYDLQQLALDLDAASENIKDADYNATMATEVWKDAIANAILNADGDTVGKREQQAMLATSQERKNMELMKYELRSAKFELDTIRTRINIAQSLGALMRSEMSLGGLIT